jgi:c-di-GMP-binding flagellar brake protein YcgR
MRRLRDGQAVSLEVESLDTNLECLVVAVEGDQAILHPVYRAYSMNVPTTSTVAMLAFEHCSRLVMLRGCARREEATLMFAVTDRVTVPQRRRYPRVEVAMPVVLTPLDAAGAPAGDPVASETRDLSADGLLVAAEVSPDLARLRVAVSIPDGLPPLESEAGLVRQVGRGSGLRFIGIAAEDRARLKRFVEALKREQLKESA